MKKALIIAGCGIILILIVGAVSQTKITAPDKEIRQIFYDNKCTDSIDDNQYKPKCAHKFANKDRYVDIFLRDLKRKIRIAYA